MWTRTTCQWLSHITNWFTKAKPKTENSIHTSLTKRPLCECKTKISQYISANLCIHLISFQVCISCISCFFFSLNISLIVTFRSVVGQTSLNSDSQYIWADCQVPPAREAITHTPLDMAVKSLLQWIVKPCQRLHYSRYLSTDVQIHSYSHVHLHDLPSVLLIGYQHHGLTNESLTYILRRS